MRVLLINLDRSVERLAMFRGQAETLGLTFERLPAVDAVTLTTARGPLTPGETACFESHRLAWRRLVESGEPWQAVFEDDAHLRPPITALLRADDWIPAGIDLVKLETFNVPVRLSVTGTSAHGVSLHRLRSPHLGSAGYIIARDYAADLLRRTEDVGDFTLPVDWALFGQGGRSCPKARVLQVVPALCIQEQWLAQAQGRPLLHESLIEHSHGRQDRPILSDREKYRREAARIGRQIRDLPVTIREVLTPGRVLTIPYASA